MKKIVYLVAFTIIFCCGTANAQINYEATYNSNTVLKYFNHVGAKWMTRPSPTDVYLYNLNHSQFRHIPVPPQTVPVNFLYLTEDLFDTDSTTFEFLLSTANIFDTCFVKIYREDGTLLFQRDSAFMFLTVLAANSDYHDYIIATDSGTKMMMAIQNGPFSRIEIYSLPGTIPCPIICNGIPWFVNGVDASGYSVDRNLSNPYPNPSSNQTHIQYHLPDGEQYGEIVFYNMVGTEVKRFKVDRTFNDLILTTSDLAAGSYYYHLQTAHAKSEGKKLIVIK